MWPPVLASPTKNEGARDDMRRAHIAAQVADDATADQFIRHAESGFFGGDEEADFVWGRRLLSSTKLPPTGGAPVSPVDG